jgi:uncharacterized protein (UPF0264 family)
MRQPTATVIAAPIHQERPGLLISVRSVDEAIRLVGLDLAILDVKEPGAGALAPAKPSTWREIVLANQQVGMQFPLSLALGECNDAVEIADQVPQEVQFAKAGPAGCETLTTLMRHWQTLRERLPMGVELVAVAYADHQAAACPPPHQVFAAAAEVGLRTWLVDTYKKDGRTTCDHMNQHCLDAVATLAREHQARWVLAGSMQRNLATRLCSEALLPDCFGVRGDVCDGSRADGLSRDKVRGWLEMLGQCDANRHPNRASNSHVAKL